MKPRRLVKLVGVFRGRPRLNPGRREPGAYADGLSERPYSLGAACLKAYCDSIPELARRYELRLENLVDRSPDAREEAELPEGAIEALLEGDPCAVAFSAYCWNFDAVLLACRELKRRRPSLVTVLGGRLPEASPAAVRARHPYVDAVISGEGERPFADLLTWGLAPGPEAAAPPLEELDLVPSPYLSGLLDPPEDGMLLEVSRGCPNSCGYCSWNSDKTRRAHSRRRLARELAWAVARGVNHVTIVDSAINYELETLRDLALARRAGDPGKTLSFSYNLRHELLDETQARWLAEIPAAQILLGLESVHQRALSAAGRRAPEPERFERALRLLRPLKAPVVGVILGLPGDSPGGFKATMRYLHGLAGREDARVEAAVVSLLQLYPGSPLRERAGRLGLRVRERGIPYLVSGPGWSREDLQDAWLHLRELRGRGLAVKGPEGEPSIVEGMEPGRRLEAVLPFVKVERREPPAAAEVLVRCTARCNQRCPFCSAPALLAEPPEALLEKAFSAAERLFPGATVTLTGGEPTLRPELPALVERLLASRAVGQVRVQTNAVAFAKGDYRARFRADPRLSFFVSLHALEPALYDEITKTKGLLAAALRGLEGLLDDGHRATVNVVVNAANAPGLESYARALAARLDGRRATVHFSALMCPEHRPEAADWLADYHDVAPRLARAVALLEARGVEVKSPLGSTHAAFPACALPPALRAGAPRRRQAVRETGVKARSCRACAFDAGCAGFPADYARRFPIEERVAPIPARGRAR